MTSFPTETTLSQSRIESGDETFVTRSYGKKRSETEFSRWAVKEFSGFACRVEPGLGSDVGNPDILVLPSSLPTLLPIEAKKGKLKGNRIYPEKVRPSQVSWWHRYLLDGGVGMLLIDCESDGIWAVNALYLREWENGYLITGGEADGAYQISTEHFTESLEAFIDTELLDVE